MPDLSHLLGAVYGDEQHDPDDPAVPVEPPDPPDWADDAHLDAAFAGWTPGPPDDAPAAERVALAEESPTKNEPVAADLATAASQALVPKRDAAAELTATTADKRHVERRDDPAVAPPQPAPLPQTEPEPSPAPLHVARFWQRSDDDILPERSVKGLRISLPLRRG